MPSLIFYTFSARGGAAHKHPTTVSRRLFSWSHTVCRTGTIRTRSGKADFSRCRVVCLDNTKYCLRQTPCTGKKSALRDCKAPQGERFSGDFVRAECRQYTVLSSDGCAKAPKRYVLRRVRIVPARHLLPAIKNRLSLY